MELQPGTGDGILSRVVIVPAPPRAAAAGATRLADLEHPWLGLESFRESTRAFFFGRDAEIAELGLRLRGQRLLTLYGRSGLGKTSILKAGLIPALRQAGHRPMLHRLGYEGVDDRPCAQLLQLLCSASDEPFGEHAPAILPEILWSLPPGVEVPTELLYTHPPSALWLALHRRDRPPHPTHLILDQFEEVFTLGSQRPGVEEEVRAGLAILLQGAVPAPVAAHIAADEGFLDHFDPEALPVRVILSLRDDYVYALNRWRRHLPQLGQNNFELRELRGAQAFAAVYRPGALRCNFRQEGKELVPAETGLPPLLSEETARRIVRFIAEEPEETPIEEIRAVPPILSLLCRELNERRFSEPPGTPTAPAAEIHFEEKTTDVSAILANFYERCLLGRPEAVRIFIEEELVSYSGHRLQQDERSCLKVFTHGCEVPGTVPPRDAPGFGDEAAARACLRELVDQRLLSTLGGDENRRFELTHDLLARTANDSRTAREERLAKLEAEEHARQEAELKVKAEAAERAERERAVELAKLKDEAERGRRSAQWLSAVAAVAFGIATFFSYSSKSALDKATAAERELRKTVEDRDATLKALQKQEEKNQDLLRAESMRAQRAADLALVKGDTAKSIGHLIRAVRFQPTNRTAVAGLWVQLRYGDFACGPIPEERGPLGDTRYRGWINFSPTGKYISYSGDEGFFIVRDLGTQKDFKLTETGIIGFNEGNCDFVGPQHALVRNRYGSNPALFDLLKEERVEAVRPDMRVSISRPLSPDGQTLICSEASGRAGLLTLPTAKFSPLLLLGSTALQAAAWTEDSTMVACAMNDQQVKIVSRDTGVLLLAGEIEGAVLKDLSFSADGRYLLAALGMGKAARETRIADRIALAEVRSPDGQLKPGPLSFEVLPDVTKATWLPTRSLLLAEAPSKGCFFVEPATRQPLKRPILPPKLVRFDEFDLTHQVASMFTDTRELEGINLATGERIGRGLNSGVIFAHRLTAGGWRLLLRPFTSSKTAEWISLPGKGPPFYTIATPQTALLTTKANLGSWNATIGPVQSSWNRLLGLRLDGAREDDPPATVAIGPWTGVAASPNGNGWLLWALIDGNTFLRTIPWNPPASVPEEILPALEVLCGWRDDPEHELVEVPLNERIGWRDELKALRGMAGQWQEVFDWWIGGRNDPE